MHSDKEPAGVLRVGQRVEVGVATEEGELDWYPSRLEDVDAESGRYTVAWPLTRHRQLVVIKPGQALRLAVPTPNDALYSTPAAVVQTNHQDGPPIVVVVAEGGWDRMQRRTAVRLAVAIRPKRVARLKDGEHGPEGQLLRSAIANISATGVQLRSLDPCSVDEELATCFLLPSDERELNVQLVVRRTRQVQQVPHSVWELGCQFRDLPEALEDHIVQYIFAQQRALARAQRAR